MKLVELLLVLVIIAGISLMGVNAYKDSSEQVNVESAKSDVTQIMSALDRYYHNQGCDVKGNFQGDVTPSIEDLELSKSFQQRMPMIENYQVKIVDTGQRTDVGKKPIYQLQVQAMLNSTLSENRQQWYQQQLNAASLEDGILLWTNLPVNVTAGWHQPLWVLSTSLMEFKKQQGMQDVVGVVSPSNCAY